ncbi:MAG: response regulator, partial [Algicola sp.]|nr:response regulator [Algicola sp.]
RFTRVDDAHVEQIPGAGIGLALVKELVTNHDGQIKLTSELGKGSTFTVTLPVCDTHRPNRDIKNLGSTTQMEIDAMSAEQAVTLHQPQNIEDTATTVLMIDDNADILTLLVETLSDRFVCLTAQNGQQGVEMALEHLPDLVISDVMMPGLSGHEVVKVLKQTELTCHIPVILLTAKGDVQSRIEAWSQNADEYLDKPFNPFELISRIDNLLSIRALLRQRFQREFNLPLEPQDLPEQNPKPNTGSNTNNDAALEVKSETDSKTAHDIAPQISQINGITDANQTFLNKINILLEHNYHDEKLDVPFMADKLAISNRQLSRKIKSLLDLTPKESIRNFRLKKAAQMLAKGLTPSDVAHQVGFTSHSYFSQCFKVQYNCMPSAYRQVG